jgi:hypothetical protein
MVIGLLAIAAIPTVTGVGQAISAQKKQNAASREQEKCYLAGMLPTSRGFEDAGFIVLIGGQVRGSYSIYSHSTIEAWFTYTVAALH